MEILTKHISFFFSFMKEILMNYDVDDNFNLKLWSFLSRNLGEDLEKL